MAMLFYCYGRGRTDTQVSHWAEYLFLVALLECPVELVGPSIT
jgi:hypothetical protein